MAMNDSVGVLGFTYTRCPDHVGKSGRLLEAKHLCVTDESNIDIVHDLDYDSSQVEILTFIRGYKRGRDQGRVVAQQKITEVVEQALQNLSRDVESIFDEGRMTAAKEWDERKKGAERELRELISKMGQSVDRLGDQQRLEQLCDRLQIFGK